jgi:NDP-sugar pyrophosphorylase family protein
MSLSVAILAGGRATRLGPIAERIPKSLVDVAGRPFAVHQIELLRRNGLTDLVFLVGHLGEAVRETLGNGARWGVRIQYVFDGVRALGTGGAIRAALGCLGDAFLVLYGDSYLDCDYASIQDAFIRSGKNGLMAVFRNEDRWDRSNVSFVEGRILAYDKRHQTSAMHHIDYGLGAFRHTGFVGRAEDEPFDLAAVYQELLASDDLAGYEVSTRFFEIGSPAGLEEARAHLSARTSVDGPA